MNILNCAVNYEVKLESGRTLLENSNVEFYLHEGNNTNITWFQLSSSFPSSNTSGRNLSRSFHILLFTVFRAPMSCYQHSTEDNADGRKSRTVCTVSL